jgi:cardiolipin synthase A/B
MFPLPLLLFACALHHPPEVPLDGVVPSEDCAAWKDAATERDIDRRTRSHVREGNRVELLVDGVRAWQRRIENTSSAEVVLVKTFIWSDDEVGRATATMLEERARAGARVIVQYDVKGSMGAAGLIARWKPNGADGLISELPIFEEMRASGVLVVPVNMPRSNAQIRRLQKELEKGTATYRFAGFSNFDHFDHEKYWITGKRQADGTLLYTAILGGLNIGDAYAYGGSARTDVTTGQGGWRDTDVQLQGPVVQDIVKRFFDVLSLNLAEEAGAWPDRDIPQPTAGSARVRFVWAQPRLWQTRRVESLYRSLLKDTPKGGEIRLETAYFAPGPRLREGMEKALRKNRRLTLLTNSKATIDTPLVGDANRAAFSHIRSVSGKAALFEWRAGEGASTLHSKVASFGCCGPVVIGSANLDGLSTVRNSEGVVAIEDPALRAEFDAMFDADLAHADRVTLENLENGGWVVHIWQSLVYRLAWSWLEG